MITDRLFLSPSERLVEQMAQSILYAHNYSPTPQEFFDIVRRVLTIGVQHMTERLDVYDKGALEALLMSPPQPIVIKKQEG